MTGAEQSCASAETNQLPTDASSYDPTLDGTLQGKRASSSCQVEGCGRSLKALTTYHQRCHICEVGMGMYTPAPAVHCCLGFVQHGRDSRPSCWANSTSCTLPQNRHILRVPVVCRFTSKCQALSGRGPCSASVSAVVAAMKSARLMALAAAAVSSLPSIMPGTPGTHVTEPCSVSW